MTIIYRYIATNLVAGWLVVLLVLASVFGLIALIQELDRTQGNYGVIEVITFTLMTLPQQLLQLAPVIALLGTIVALASLDKNNELAVISCAGVPVRTLLAAIAVPTVVLMLALWLCLEYVSAPLYQQAQQLKSATRNEHPDVLPNGGVWSKHGNRYIHLGKMRDGNKPGDIELFRFSDGGELLLALNAQTAKVSPDRAWQFQNVKQKRLHEGALETTQQAQLKIDNLWASAELPTLSLSDESMRLSVLYRYSKYLAANKQPHETYSMAFWQRLTMPLTVGAMVVLATPLSAGLGSRRNRNFGVNMGLGALIGIFFFLGTQIVFALGQLLQMSPQLTALLPTGIVLLCAAFMFRQMRW